MISAVAIEDVSQSRVLLNIMSCVSRVLMLTASSSENNGSSGHVSAEQAWPGDSHFSVEKLVCVAFAWGGMIRRGPELDTFAHSECLVLMLVARVALQGSCSHAAACQLSVRNPAVFLPRA